MQLLPSSLDVSRRWAALRPAGLQNPADAWRFETVPFVLSFVASHNVLHQNGILPDPRALPARQAHATGARPH
jgi:hypothetical protein